MSYEVFVDDDTGFYVFDILIERWQATPKKFPFDQRAAIIPQNIIPAKLRADTEELFNFYLNICLYMRGGIESLQAFRAMIRLWQDKRELFDPFYAEKLYQDELQPILRQYVGWDSHAAARYWIENAKRLVWNWEGKASNVFRGLRNHEEAMRRIQNKRTKKELQEANSVDGRGQGFMGFQAKMVSMWLYFMDWEGLLEESFLYPTPADFHNFRLGLAHRILVLEPEPEEIRSAEKISKPWRELTMRYLQSRRGKVTPVQLADAIWLFSLTLCGNSPLTDYHERVDNNGHGMFDPNDLEHSSRPDFLSSRFRSRLQRTCLSCPLIDTCELAIPAGPYYQRRGDRDVPFGGRLYLWDRFPIEHHLPTFEPDYLPLEESEDNGEHPQFFAKLPEQLPPLKPLTLDEVE